MKWVKMVLPAGIFWAFTSATTFAVPLNITFTGGTPVHEWGLSAIDDPGFLDNIPVASAPTSINLAGVNSINITWSAPAGDMYVVNPPPAGLYGGAGLSFEAAFGSPGQASSLGSITSSSLSVQTVYGTSPLTEQTLMNSGNTALSVDTFAVLGSGSSAFAFTSITLSMDFSGTGTSETLDRTAADPLLGYFFGSLTGDFAANGPGTFDVLPDPGPLLVLEPLSNGSVPDHGSTLTLAGLSFGLLLLLAQKRMAVNV